jgi:diacylglycerol O-acyltransferase / wax synthase
MQRIVPIAFLPDNHALAIAIMSYNGKVDFGLLADYDALPDLDAFGDYLQDSLAELLKAARKRSAAAARANGAKKGTPGSASRAPKAAAPEQG